MGFLNTFETWFLEDLGTPTYLIGLTKTIQCFGAEPVLFFLSTYILRKIGYFYSYSVAFVLFACKAIGYSFLRDVWGSLAVNIVGGAIFPMVYAAMAVFAKKKARPGTAASMVCILGANYDGLGSAAGSLVGGLSINKIGGSLTFRYIGFSSVAAALLSALCYLLLRCTADDEYGNRVPSLYQPMYTFHVTDTAFVLRRCYTGEAGAIYSFGHRLWFYRLFAEA
ncbi:major facilitator superfamily domain-containing protein 6-like [Rhipicephalus sanguineus]|uniref:major facilitator superfamily domain-containing protein 6-like n=1 Tax=Rhipicephalus sanguineus TaxID=34632 RepID=UPI0020C50724|nr:major facilitator superfamily domain-containing protein 6-like [Rhipicephalus sanguineus]